jgi:hypothetical protein
MKRDEKVLYNEIAQHNLQNVDASPLMRALQKGYKMHLDFKKVAAN